MNPESLESLNQVSQDNEMPLNQQLGELFADAATNYYFKHLPKENAERFYDAIYSSFTSEPDLQNSHSLYYAAGMFNEAFNFKPDSEVKLYGSYQDGNLPGLELDSNKVLARLIRSGGEVLNVEENNNLLEEFKTWFSAIENALNS